MSRLSEQPLVIRWPHLKTLPKCGDEINAGELGSGIVTAVQQSWSHYAWWENLVQIKFYEKVEIQRPETKKEPASKGSSRNVSKADLEKVGKKSRGKPKANRANKVGAKAKVRRVR